MPFWIEWRLACALERCGEETQVKLRAFVAQRFVGYVRSLDLHAGLPMVHDDELPDAWQLFETRMLSDRRRDGKVYKIWLFDRLEGSSASAQDTVESGVSMRVRDWAKQWWNQHRRPLLQICSLDEPVGPDHGAPTRGDLLKSLGSPLDAVSLVEYTEIAEAIAGKVFTNLGVRERMVLLARMLGLAFSHPAVEQATGSKKTVLYQTFDGASQKLRSALASDYVEEPRDSLILLEQLSMRALGDLLWAWGKAERSCETFFNILGHEVSNGEIADN